MKQNYEYRGKTFSIDLSPSGKSYQASIGGKTFKVELVRLEGAQLDLLIDGQPTHATINRDGQKRWVTLNGQTLLLVNSVEARKSSAQAAGQLAGQIMASMPAVVRALPVAEGDHVLKGQTLAILEAMKMENKLTAPFDGLVKRMMISIGQTVERDQILMEITKGSPDNNPDKG